MPVFNQNRNRIIKIIFIAVFCIIVLQLMNLQLVSSKYKILADNNAILRKTVYPDRGIIFDRKKRSLLENSIMYDLLVTPAEIKGMDTLALCNLLNIDTIEFKRRIINLIRKTGSHQKQAIFEPLLSNQMYARLNENMYRLPGFVLNERSIRTYPFNIAANVLGYIAEVDTGFLRRHREEGYEMGDYAGLTGLERNYEKVLMGQRGVKRLIRDKLSRSVGSYENGLYDTTALTGKSLYLSLDADLQKLGEKLMTNKVGSIVAINPKTGGILCMVSAPNYDPNFLTGSERRKHFSALYKDPRKPLLNRTLATYYSPGSTFKTVVGIVGMSESIINNHFTVGCGGAYYGCGRMGCHAKGTFNLKGAIAESCNSYFATVYRKIIDADKYVTRDSALETFNKYAYSFGLGSRLGVDLPSEKRGIIPTSKYYQKIFGRKWFSCNIVSNSIGQGEVTTTLTQLANVMATIANKGWYYTPHMVDSIEGGDKFNLLDSFKVKHYTVNISDSIFEEVHNGMQGTMEFGTGAAAKIDGIVVCGKTGTVENAAKVNGKMEKQKDHAFFGAFAPRNNPKIAIAVMCENAGFGATSAAPIASLLIEKYLKDSIVGKERHALEDRVTKLYLIPHAMQVQIDSMKRAEELLKQQLANAGKESKDSIPEIDEEETPEKKPLPSNDSLPSNRIDTSAGALLIDKKWWYLFQNLTHAQA